MASDWTDILDQTDRGGSWIKADIDSGDWGYINRETGREPGTLGGWGAGEVETYKQRNISWSPQPPQPPPPPPPVTEFQMKTEKAIILQNFLLK